MTWVLTFISLIGVVLNILKKRSCFLIWIVSNTVWAVIDFRKDIPAQGCLFTIYVILAIWGWLAWRKE
jgi:nicotinamide riboside transporter PnuC